MADGMGRSCVVCGRPLDARRGRVDCSSCAVRASAGTPMVGRPMCEVKGCWNIATSCQGHRCRVHVIPQLHTHLEPGPLNTPCAIVDGAGRHRDDYGYAWLDGRTMRAHRWTWIVCVGPIPAGLYVCHHCDRPGCVAVEHLFVGPPGDNVRDMFAKGRHRFVRGDRTPATVGGSR